MRWGLFAAVSVALLGMGLPVSAEEGVTSDTLNPLRGLAKDKLSGFKDRPLFNPSRSESRPPVVDLAPAPIAQPPEPPPALRLVGIIDGLQPLAVVRPLEGGKTSVLGSGDTVGAWTVTVRPDSVHLQADTRGVDLTLFKGAGGAPQTGPPGEPTPPAAKGADSFPPTGDPPPP